MIWPLTLIKPQKATSVVDEQKYEAQRQYVSHKANAEHHEALSTMYLKRLERLDTLPKEIETV